MTSKIRNQAYELEDELHEVHRLDEEFYRELLHDYEILIYQLKANHDLFPLDRAIDIENKRIDIEARLPNVSDEEFEEYVLCQDLLGILYEGVK